MAPGARCHARAISTQNFSLKCSRPGTYMLQPVCNRSTIATYRKRSCSGCHRHGFGQPWSVFWHATHTSWHLVQGAVRAPYPLKTLAWSAAGQVQTFCSPCATVALLQRIANEAAVVAMGMGLASLGPIFLRGRMSRMFLSFYVVMFIKDHIHIYDTRVIRTLLKSICLIPLGRLL